MSCVEHELLYFGDCLAVGHAASLLAKIKSNINID
jgi:hypothetical protein